MGGGDLNLKKSWHPSTLRNIERVWKAEQKHEAEQKKIEQLQRELADERNKEEIRHFAEDQGVLKKKSERLDWMYQGPGALVDKEQYLLGRKVDKTFESAQQQEQSSGQQQFNDETPGSVFNTTGNSGNATVDLANKIREDPLFAIRKKEEEQKKRLLDNPVKMKQLQNLLKQSLSKKDKKKKKKSKKKSKKRQRKSSNLSDQSDSDSVNEGVSNRHNHKAGTKNSHHHKSSKDSRNGKSSFYVKAEKSDSDSEDEKIKKRMKQYGLIVPHSRESSHKTELKKHKSRERSRSPVTKHRSASKDDKHYRHSENEKYERQKLIPNNSQNDKPKRKLNEKEMEQLRQEMMENAKWREEQRRNNIKHYKEENEKEKLMEKKKTSKFINPLLAEAASKGTIEKSVKQKIYNIQRNKADMDRNFIRR